MNIQDLPNGLQELVEKRRSEEQERGAFFSDTFTLYTFQWSKTKEGFDFWASINNTNPI